MKTSAAGLAAIEAREGRRLVAYQDSTGVWTIGVGHTGLVNGVAIGRGMTITSDQCDQLFATDIVKFENALNKALTVPVTQNEFDALVSWLYNVGTGYASSSNSTIIRDLNKGDVAGAAAAFDLYHKPPEVISRRDGEKAQFLTPDATTTKVSAARSTTLTTAAKAATTTSQVAAGGASAAATVGAAVTSILVATSHPTVATVLGGATGFLAIVQAFYAWWSGRAATTLTANATTQLSAAIAG